MCPVSPYHSPDTIEAFHVDYIICVKKILILLLIMCLSVAYVYKSQCVSRRQSRLS